MNPFEKLKKHLVELADIRSAIAIMTWDQEVNMAPGSAARRARQISTLSGIMHERLVGKTHDLLEAAKASDLDELQIANMVEIEESLNRSSKLPTEFVMKTAEKTSLCQQAWLGAKQSADFALFRDSLKELVDLKREETVYRGFESNPYDSLLEEYESGMTTESVRSMFEELKGELLPLMNSLKAMNHDASSIDALDYDQDKVWKWQSDIAAAIGYDLNRGRIDVSAHPFTIPAGMEDVRITTASDMPPLKTIFFTIHEAGHGMYEQGLDPEWYGFPSALPCSIGIHESQSRLYENNVGRELPFWTYAFESLSELYSNKLDGISPTDVFAEVNRFNPGAIRIDADELSYHFHILLRFELEDKLINGAVEVEDLRDAWNDIFHQYFGFHPANDAEGVLQDIHWAHGSFGYFPTYTLGSLYASQFFETAKKDLGDLDGMISKGEFAPLHNWLKANIYKPGKSVKPTVLCKQVSGSELKAEYFIRNIKRKFAAVYQLDA